MLNSKGKFFSLKDISLMVKPDVTAVKIIVRVYNILTYKLINIKRVKF